MLVIVALIIIFETNDITVFYVNFFYNVLTDFDLQISINTYA